ncbi:fimbrial biogenesis chaperone [Kosakonia oryzae]|uniref:fimbrial biogenesis chaperone n=1 Tax=Kosakonia oryzae TaxID=497725 RepID=UPI00386EC6EB
MSRFFILLFVLFVPATLAGVMPAVTRVIYPPNAREKTLMLVNTNAWPVIVQTWADNGEGSPDNSAAPFVILPPVFRLAPGSTQGLRIIYNHDPLPTDRESVFWLNVYEVPPDSADLEKSYLKLAMNTQLKIFYRPQTLTLTPEEAIGKLTFRLYAEGENSWLEFNNPTPLGISFTTISVTGRSGQTKAYQQDDMMIKPFSQRRYLLERNVGSEAINVEAGWINDSGEILKHRFMK